MVGVAASGGLPVAYERRAEGLPMLVAEPEVGFVALADAGQQTILHGSAQLTGAGLATALPGRLSPADSGTAGDTPVRFDTLLGPDLDLKQIA